MTSRHPSAPPRPADLLVHRADLGDVAWQVLLRDGHVLPLHGDVGLPAGVPASPALRAAALAGRVTSREAVARTAAVWVHLGGPPPGRVHAVAVAALAPRDVVGLGGVRVTTPRRAALDVLTLEPPDVARAALARLARAGLDLGQVQADVTAAATRRGVRRALEVLRALRDEQGAFSPP